MELSIGYGTYAIWMAAWIAVWAVAGFVWLQVHWIRRAIRAYHQLSPAERLFARAKHFRDHHAKPAVTEWQRQFNDWRKNRG